VKNNLKVLVVEDVEIAQKMAKLTLVGLHCSVDIAEHGQRALELFEQNTYDLIFMDLGLPDISGLDVTKAIRELEKGESHVPIVALSANYDESLEQSGLEMGVDAFMLKPLNKDNAQAMLNQFVKAAVS